MSCLNRQSTARRTAKRGFTLIEISIVLIIIGLVAAGILVGRDLIRAADIRATIQQVEAFDVAVNAFRNKYNCLPGDCATAANFGFAALSSGDGNGVVGFTNTPGCGFDAPCETDTRHENVDFWYHLSAAGLIPGAFPPSAPVPEWFNSIIGIATPPTRLSLASRSAPYSDGFGQNMNAMPRTGGWAVVGKLSVGKVSGMSSDEWDVIPGHSFVTSMFVAYPETITGGYFNGYFPADSYAIDKKIDDGLPFSGKARASGSIIVQNGKTWLYVNDNWFGHIDPMLNPASTFCVLDDTEPWQYNVKLAKPNTTGNCGLAIRGSF